MHGIRRFALAAAFAAAAGIAPLPSWATPPEELVTELRPLVETGLASEDVAVMTWAIRAAGLLGARDLRSTLTAALENANAPVRIAAATTLIDLEVSTSDAEEVLVSELLTGDAPTRTLLLQRVINRLPERNRTSILRGALRSVTDSSVRTEILNYIARRESGDVYDLLAQVVTMDSSESRAPYIEALRRAGRPEALAIAQTMIRSRNGALHVEGAEICFSMNTAEAREMLGGLLGDADSALAQRVGFHLARFGDSTALDRVRDFALNTAMPEEERLEALAIVRDHGAALISFEQIEAMLEEEGRTPAFRERVHEVMGATRSPEALAHLREMVDAPFADQRLDGISGIGFTGQSDAVEPLRAIMTGYGEIELRIRAARSLGHLGGDAAAEVLLAALRVERVDELKVEIIRALGDTGSSLAAQPIAYELSGTNSAIVLAALDAIAALGDSSVSSTIESLSSTFRDPGVRWRATLVLAALDPEAGRIRLLQALERPPESFLTDLEALPDTLRAEIDEALLVHNDQDIRAGALFRVLARPDGGLSVMRRMVTDATSPDVRREAIATVVNAGLPEDAPIFRSLVEHTERAVRLQGLSALAELGDVSNDEFFRGYVDHTDIVLREIAAYALLRMHANG